VDVNEVIADRTKTHGDYQEVAKVHHYLMAAVKKGPAYNTLTPVQEMSLLMIVHKISRVVSGNPNLADHWLDIEGYARLARLEIEKI